jgi:hypothetical protein
MSDSPWTRLDQQVELESALEVRAEPDGRGGWHIRTERATGSTGRMMLGFLVADQPYAVRIASTA